MITVYSQTRCPNCVTASKILLKNKIEFHTISVDKEPTAHAFLISKGHKSVPQFYDGDTYLGDYYSYISKIK